MGGSNLWRATVVSFCVVVAACSADWASTHYVDWWEPVNKRQNAAVMVQHPVQDAARCQILLLMLGASGGVWMPGDEFTVNKIFAAAQRKSERNTEDGSNRGMCQKVNEAAYAWALQKASQKAGCCWNQVTATRPSISLFLPVFAFFSFIFSKVVELRTSLVWFPTLASWKNIVVWWRLRCDTRFDWWAGIRRIWDGDAFGHGGKGFFFGSSPFVVRASHLPIWDFLVADHQRNCFLTSLSHLALS